MGDSWMTADVKDLRVFLTPADELPKSKKRHFAVADTDGSVHLFGAPGDEEKKVPPIQNVTGISEIALRMATPVQRMQPKIDTKSKLYRAVVAKAKAGVDSLPLQLVDDAGQGIPQSKLKSKSTPQPQGANPLVSNSAQAPIEVNSERMVKLVAELHDATRSWFSAARKECKRKVIKLKQAERRLHEVNKKYRALQKCKVALTSSSADSVGHSISTLPGVQEHGKSTKDGNPDDKKQEPVETKAADGAQRKLKKPTLKVSLTAEDGMREAQRAVAKVEKIVFAQRKEREREMLLAKKGGSAPPAPVSASALTKLPARKMSDEKNKTSSSCTIQPTGMRPLEIARGKIIPKGVEASVPGGSAITVSVGHEGSTAPIDKVAIPKENGQKPLAAPSVN